MKWNRRLLAPAAAGLLCFAGAAKADLGRWIQEIRAPGKLQAVFFRPMAVGVSSVDVRRPPNETRAELGKLIGAAPSEADLYALRAQEDEMQLDVDSAEKDWKTFAQLASDKVGANLSLADFYHRRLKPAEEIAALELVGKAPTSAAQRFKPVAQQEAWKAFDRIEKLIGDQALAQDLARSEYRAWIERYPAERSIRKRLFDFLVEKKDFAEAQNVLASYRQAFASDATYIVAAEAAMAETQGSPEDAARVYDQSFQPLWPQDLVKSYFDLLKRNHALRRFLEQARAQVAAHPTEIGPVARVYDYYQQSGNIPGSLRALYEYRQRKSTYTAEELWTLGQLFERAHNADEAARSYYALYSLSGGNNQERAMGAIANLLLTSPEQAIGIGTGDLSLYRDIATMDPGPGFLNGLLSLLLNSTGPASAYATENQASLAYFHRAKASELISEFDRRFPNSAARAGLHAQLIAAYVTYGDDAGVLRAGREYLAGYPTSPSRAEVALDMADAYARQEKTQEEFAIYEDLLRELSAKAENVPLGEIAVPRVNPGITPTDEGAEAPATTPGSTARSPEYARILDRYIGRLVALKKPQEALALYRREIDRNPNDPGLYERLAAFLEQNRMGAQIEEVYRKAMAQFQDPNWSHKLARWFLRRKQNAQFEALTREVLKTFSGTELEAYLNAAEIPQSNASLALYRQVNVYAHQRFPYDLQFVNNLIRVGGSNSEPALRENLLRQYWFYSPGLRDMYFESLSSSGRLQAQLASIGKTDAARNPAAAQFAAEAQAWQSHFETAAPLFRQVAAEYPGDVLEQTRAASIYRSLATYDAEPNRKNTEVAAALEQNIAKYAPRDSAALTRTGEIYADRELFDLARPFWNRVATIEPGRSEGYLEAATVFWDYYHFDDALRLIAEGRRQLGNPRLFSYETGAIHENRRNYTRALEEYAKGALAEPVDGRSRARLVQLAKRPGQRAAIEDLTAQAASAQDAALAAVSLRTEVLTAGNRRDELRQFLLATTGRTRSFEVLQYVDQTAGVHAFYQVQEQSRLRQIALSTDPVERMQEQVALVHYYEGRHDPAAAGRILGDLYKNHSTVLGVIRTNVDFYWRTKNSKRAIDILAESAAKAEPAYRDPFTLEAARKATEAGDYPRARSFLASLLKENPFQAQYLAAMADTYARQGDDSGLRDFYSERLKAISQAELPASQKIERAAELRRGLIPVLTRLKDYTGAVDQYIEILNRYPEDTDLAHEAANYAAAHGGATQLVAYYQDTEKKSPRDFRWPLVEARVQTQLEDFPAAVAAYTRAAQVRPDRVDFYEERATLEERLIRFDAAAGTYAKLYELNYHNSQWMERLGAVRARQGKTAEAVKAVETAFITGRAAKPEYFFTAAQRLESWNMLPEAQTYAEKGVALAGASLLTDYDAGAQTYMRIETRLRRYGPAWQKLTTLGQGQDPEAVKAILNSALREMGTTIALYFTPEEKSAFATFVGNRLGAFLPALETAGLADVLARALADDPQRLIPLQQSRLHFGQLAALLEAYAKRDAEARVTYLDMAAENYRLAGDTGNELRVLTLRNDGHHLSGPALDRFAELLMRYPQRLESVAAGDSDENVRNAVSNFPFKAGDPARSFGVIAARGGMITPVWQRAYTALTGLYFLTNTPAVNDAFHQALGSATIGERLGKPIDRTQQLAGDVWFDYGFSYGEFLAATKQPDSNDYLPASVEGRPGSSDAYFQTAEYYSDRKQPAPALEQYRYALQLNEKRIDAHERIATLLASQSKRDEAVLEFRAALTSASREQDQRRAAESFWTDVEDTLEDIGAAHLLEPLRAEADGLLRTYIRRNGDFRVEPLMQGAIAAAGDAAAGVAWIIDLSRAAPEPSVFLSSVVKSDWVPEAQRTLVYRALIEAARAKPELLSSLPNYQVDFAAYLVAHGQPGEAQAVLADLSEEQRKMRVNELLPLEVRIAVQNNQLQKLLDRLTADPELPSKLDSLRNAATQLETAGNQVAARQILEFVYTRRIESRQLDSSVFLGLAEIRIAQNDLAAAVALLRRMTLVAGQPFDDLSDAAHLLMRTGHAKDALPFLEQRVQAVPWDAQARADLAEVQGVLEPLKTVAQSAEAPYAARVSAARSIRGLKAGAPGALPAGPAQELSLLAGASISPAAAEKPYFYYARVDAAAQTKDAAPRVRLLEGAIAINPNVGEGDKVELIRSALEAKRWRTAVAAANQVPGVMGGATIANPFSGRISRFRMVQRTATAAVFGLPAPSLSSHKDLAPGLGRAEEALGDLVQAMNQYQLAGSDGEVKRMSAILARHAENERRRPVIRQQLEQDHMVRPRLIATGGGQ